MGVFRNTFGNQVHQCFQFTLSLFWLHNRYDIRRTHKIEIPFRRTQESATHSSINYSSHLGNISQNDNRNCSNFIEITTNSFTFELSAVTVKANDYTLFWDYSFSTYARFSEKLFLPPDTYTRAQAYQGVKNVSFSKNFAYILNE